VVGTADVERSWVIVAAAGSVRRAAALNLALVLAVSAGFWWLYTEAFRDDFTCRALIIERYDMPEAVCEGAIGTEGIVGDALDLMGADTGDNLVPGLEAVIDPPLRVVRKLSIVAYLGFLVVLSVVMTVIVANARRLVRLLRLDRQEWMRLMLGMRLYLAVLLGLSLASLLFVVAVS
jgi:hypothetical protein